MSLKSWSFFRRLATRPSPNWLEKCRLPGPPARRLDNAAAPECAASERENESAAAGLARCAGIRAGWGIFRAGQFCLESARRPMKCVGMPEPDGLGEWFDVVDENDQIVGRAPRREVHARGLTHRAVHVLVFNREGELFLQKRSMTKDTAPGVWDSSASGHLGVGEDYDTCAVRELAEEIGLRTTGAPQRWLRLPACPDSGREFVWVYRLEAEGPFVLNPEEIERGGWFAPGEIARLVREEPARFADSFRLIWRNLAARGDVPS